MLHPKSIRARGTNTAVKVVTLTYSLHSDIDFIKWHCIRKLRKTARTILYNIQLTSLFC